MEEGRDGWEFNCLDIFNLKSFNHSRFANGASPCFRILKHVAHWDPTF